MSDEAVALKLVPEMVTLALAIPNLGLKLLMTGTGSACDKTGTSAVKKTTQPDNVLSRKNLLSLDITSWIEFLASRWRPKNVCAP